MRRRAQVEELLGSKGELNMSLFRSLRLMPVCVRWLTMFQPLAILIRASSPKTASWSGAAHS